MGMKTKSKDEPATSPEPLHRRTLAPLIKAQVKAIRARDRRLKARILAMEDPSPFARSILEGIKAREDLRLLESLGLKADENPPRR
jgi:hypothetical protein